MLLSNKRLEAAIIEFWAYTYLTAISPSRAQQVLTTSEDSVSTYTLCSHDCYNGKNLVQWCFFERSPSQSYTVLSIHYLTQNAIHLGARHACTNHYKFSALMSLRSRDNVQAKCTELVVIRARMSDLLWSGGIPTNHGHYNYYDKYTCNN